MARKWKEIRVFISSTFRDMHAERDHLIKVVFPELRERLEKHRFHLVFISLMKKPCHLAMILYLKIFRQLFRLAVILIAITLAGCNRATTPDDLEKVIENASRQIGQYPDNPDLYMNRGYAKYNLLQVKSAISDFSRAIELGGGENAYLSRAAAYHMEGMLDAATEDIRHAEKLTPGHYAVHAARSSLAQTQGDLQLALSEINTALHETIPKRMRTQLLIRRAALHNLMTDYAAALKDLNEAAMHRPRPPSLYLQRCVTHHMLGEDSQFDLYRDKYLSLRPGREHYLKTHLEMAERQTMLPPKEDFRLALESDRKAAAGEHLAIGNADSTSNDPSKPRLRSLHLDGMWPLSILVCATSLMLVSSLLILTWSAGSYREALPEFKSLYSFTHTLSGVFGVHLLVCTGVLILLVQSVFQGWVQLAVYSAITVYLIKGFMDAVAGFILLYRIQFGFWKSQSPSNEPRIFISYKSEDSKLVRDVCESLFSVNANVWFAEYRIPLYEQQSFLQQYTLGIHSSDIFLIFLHKHYPASDYCCDELHKINNKLKDAGKPKCCLVIHAGDDQLPPDFKGAIDSLNAQHITSRNADEISRYICQHYLRKTLHPTICEPDDTTNTYQWEYQDTSIQLNLCGWKLTRRDTSCFKYDPSGFAGPEAIKKIGGSRCRLWWTLEPPDQTMSSRTMTTLDDNPIDDKDFNKALKHYAESYMRRHAILKCVGTHAIFLRESGGLLLGQLGLTYWGSKNWVRRYSVMLPHPGERDKTWEAHFFFTYDGPFKAFCEATREIERVLTSFKWSVSTDEGGSTTHNVARNDR